MLNFDGSMGGTSIWCSSETKKTCQVLGSTMLAALKANLVPGICLLIMEVILIVLYFYCVECDQGFAFLSALKSEWGYIYSALATSFFGGLFPWGIGLVTNEIPRDNTKLVIATFFFLIIHWAVLGVVIDAFYRFQGFLFGTDGSIATVVKKVCFDMFVWTPICGLWLSVIPFHWRTAEFSCTRFWDTFTVKTLLITASAALCTTWAVWIPAVTVVYSLPSDLQIPIFNFILCFSNLILMFVTRSLGSRSNQEEIIDVELKSDGENEMKPLLNQNNYPTYENYDDASTLEFLYHHSSPYNSPFPNNTNYLNHQSTHPYTNAV